MNEVTIGLLYKGRKEKSTEYYNNYENTIIFRLKRSGRRFLRWAAEWYKIYEPSTIAFGSNPHRNPHEESTRGIRTRSIHDKYRL
jgi:hypothetical protein